MKKLIPALALQPRDSAETADDGLDALLECLTVDVLRQAIKRLSKVGAGVPVRHLGEHLDQGVPAKLQGFLGQVGCPGGLEQLQGSKDTLKEFRQPSALGHSCLMGEPEVWHAHGGQLHGNLLRDIHKVAGPKMRGLDKLVVGRGGSPQ